MKNNNKKLTTKEKGQLFAEQIAKHFLSVLSYSGSAWVKEWRGPSMAPINGISKKKYRYCNQFKLALVAMLCGYSDPRWYTFNQIADYKGIYHKDKKWHLKEGTKGEMIYFEFPYDKVEKKNLAWEELHRLIKEEGRDPSDFFKKRRYYTVFNAEHVEGVEPYTASIHTFDTHPNETVLELAQKMGVNISYDGGDRAFYRPSNDTVHLPKAEHFFSSVAWAGTTLHELGHASGAEKRMNRVGIVKKGIGTFDEEYAYEELVAEIISVLMCYNLGIDESEDNIRNHEAYVASWIEDIQNKPESLLNAIKEAQKASDYMMNVLEPNSISSSEGENGEVDLDVA